MLYAVNLLHEAVDTISYQGTEKSERATKPTRWKWRHSWSTSYCSTDSRTNTLTQLQEM